MTAQADVVHSTMRMHQQEHSRELTLEPLCGSLLKPTKPVPTVAHFAIVEHCEGVGRTMQDIALDTWNLKAPKVLISVTGGAQNFQMSRVNNDKLMHGLMQVAIDTSVWFVTGGTNTGIMKLVGEARTHYAADAPLIGVSAFGSLKGGTEIQTQLRIHNSPNSPGPKLVQYPKILEDQPEKKVLKEKEEEAKKQFMKENPGFEDLCKEQKKKKKKGSAWEHAEQDCTAAELDPGHSHFFLIQSNKNDKTGNGFGTEIPSRTAFEERVNKHGRPVTDQTEQERTPMVLLCVQGGPGTVNTVLSALKKRMPVLLVKGSGQAADLIAGSPRFLFFMWKTGELSLMKLLLRTVT